MQRDRRRRRRVLRHLVRGRRDLAAGGAVSRRVCADCGVRITDGNWGGTLMVTWTEEVARPDGSVYRARRTPSVEEFGGYGHGTSDPTGMLVARTHDVDVACALVERRWRFEFGGPLPVPTRRWMRLVPWSSDGGYDSSWIDEGPIRGAVPVVEFRLEDW